MSVTVYFLILNDMRGSYERDTMIAASFDRDKIVKFITSEMVEPYDDCPSMDDYGNVHKWHKVFKKGGPLEWFNPPLGDMFTQDCHGRGLGSQTWEFATEEDKLDIMQNAPDSVTFLM